jgi:hypothetical protein
MEQLWGVPLGTIAWPGHDAEPLPCRRTARSRPRSSCTAIPVAAERGTPGGHEENVPRGGREIMPDSETAKLAQVLLRRAVGRSRACTAGRSMPAHRQAAPPPGEARSDLQILDLALRLGRGISSRRGRLTGADDAGSSRTANTTSRASYARLQTSPAFGGVRRKPRPARPDATWPAMIRW